MFCHIMTNTLGVLDNDFPFIQIQTLILHIICSNRLHNPAKVLR